MEMQEKPKNYNQKEDSSTSSQPYNQNLQSSQSFPAPQASSPPLPQIFSQDSAERRFSKNDLVDILDKAWLFNEAEKTSQSRREAIFYETREDANDLSMTYLYHRAESLNISKEQIDKVISLYHPSNEEQFAHLQQLGAHPTKRLVLSKYLRELLNSLRNTFPLDKFKSSPNYIKNFFSIYRIKEVEKEERFLFWKWKIKEEEKEEIAEYNVNTKALIIYDKDFTTATAKKLKELQKEFNLFESINYEYTVGSYL